MLTTAGGLAFWVANFAISLTPIAGGYRAALSIAYLPMLCEALAGGMVIALLVAYSLQRLFDRIPVRGPVLKAVALSGVAVVAVTVLVETPAKLIAAPVPDAHNFLVALLFNALRILALGVAIGAVGRRLLDQPRDGSSGV